VNEIVGVADQPTRRRRHIAHKSTLLFVPLSAGGRIQMLPRQCRR
jgi:hypothetical protein